MKPPESRLASRARSPAGQLPAVLLVDADGEAAKLLAACTRREIRLPLQLVADEETAWDLLSRRGDFSAHEQAPALLVLGRAESGREPLTLLRRLRGTPLMRHLPAVLLTAGGRPSREADDAGVSPLLYLARAENPADFDRLASELSALLPDF